MTQNKLVKCISVRWSIFLKEWIKQGSNLHRLLTQERENIRENGGNPNPRTDYNQDDTNDDFRTMLDQDGKPFWLPLDGKTDRSLSPWNPEKYSVTRQLVLDSVRQRTADYKAPEGNTDRVQLADRNTTVKPARYPDFKNKRISNGFALCHLVPREIREIPAWKTSLSKADINQEFESIIALAAPNVRSATHFYLREKSPKTQQEEDARPVLRSDEEQFFWKISKTNVGRRCSKHFKHLSVERVQTGRGAYVSNGFYLYWIRRKSTTGAQSS